MRLRIAFLCLCALSVLRPLVAAPAETFQIAGAVGKPRTAHAVPLWAVLNTAQPKINPQIKRHLLQFVAAVSGRDGYTVDFTLGEVSPDFGANAVWIAWDEDGKPLPEDAGPVELLVPEDKRAARWVHGVAAVTLSDMAQAGSPGPVSK